MATPFAEILRHFVAFDAQYKNSGWRIGQPLLRRLPGTDYKLLVRPVFCD